MDVKITPHPISGELAAISSKSDVHRLLICAALSDRPCKIYFSGLSDDILATISCLRALGAQIDASASSISVIPLPCAHPSPLLDFRECGSTARFMLPVAAALCGDFSATGHGGLPLRPLSPLCSQMELNGCRFISHSLPFSCSGKLTSGHFELQGNISSQYFTGLLLALPVLEGDSVISLLSPLQSRSYVDMTLAAMRLFGINIDVLDDRFEIKGGQRYISPLEVSADGDWSNGAFWLCGGAVCGNITLDAMNMESLQGDRHVTDILRAFGADISVLGGKISATRSRLCATEIDAGQIPDLVPVLAVVASVSEGKTLIYNAARLRIKESDRLESTAAMINNLGGCAEICGDSLAITGRRKLCGGTVDSFSDHRIAMSAAIASCLCENEVIVKNAHAINKSYPDFFKHFTTLGGKYNVIKLR